MSSLYDLIDFTIKYSQEIRGAVAILSVYGIIGSLVYIHHIPRQTIYEQIISEVLAKPPRMMVSSHKIEGTSFTAHVTKHLDDRLR